MKTTQSSVVKAAVLGVLGLLSTNTFAAVDLSGQFSSAAPVKLGKELPALATSTQGTPIAINSAGQLAATIAVPTAYALDTTNKYLNVKVNLLGGATFKTAPTLHCNVDDTKDGTVSANSAAGSISIGGANASNVTFVLSTTNNIPAAAASAVCIISATDLYYSGTTDKTISATIEYRDGATPVVSGANGTYISFVKGVSANFTPASTPPVIDVAASSNKFTAGGATGFAGSVKYGAVGSVFSANLADALGAASILGSNTSPLFSVTIGGAPLAGATNVYLSSVVNNCSVASYSATISTSASTTLTISAIAANDISNGLGVCLVYSGTTPIPEGTITATISRNMETNSYQPDFSPIAASLASFKKNGASTYVDFLTSPTGFPTYVRFTNPTSLTGNVLVDAYNDDGGKGTTTWTFTLSAGASVMYPLSEIVTKTAVPAVTTAPPSGANPGNKYRLVVNAEFPTISVQSLSVSKDGNSFGQLSSQRGGQTQ